MKIKNKISEYYKKRNGYQGPLYEYESTVLSFLKQGVTLLDVGCGRTFPMAKKWLKSGANVLGVDPVGDASLVPPGSKIYKGNAEKIPLNDNEIDVVVSCAVLEHIVCPEQLFEECRRVLKPGGRIIHLTPSRYDYVSIAAQLIPNSLHGKIVKFTEGRDEMDTFPTFYRANSFKQIKALAKEAGFEIESFRYLDQSPYVLKSWPVLYRFASYYHYIVRSVPWFNFLNGWILCVLNKSQSS
ncbi:MAG: class I SAM-dependent methyltransferase [Desulfobacula sp.]|jgi:ubiquinone/menaquinone biosynthesis C-methylase UbiE